MLHYLYQSRIMHTVTGSRAHNGNTLKRLTAAFSFDEETPPVANTHRVNIRTGVLRSIDSPGDLSMDEGEVLIEGFVLLGWSFGHLPQRRRHCE